MVTPGPHEDDPRVIAKAKRRLIYARPRGGKKTAKVHIWVGGGQGSLCALTSLPPGDPLPPDAGPLCEHCERIARALMGRAMQREAEAAAPEAESF